MLSLGSVGLTVIRCFVVILFIFFFHYFFNFFKKQYYLKLSNIIKNNIILYSCVFLLGILSLLPINDADSYAYHLAWPKKFIDNPDILFEKSFLEFRVIGIGEMTNLLGLVAFTQNLQSFLVIIVGFFYFFLKKNDSLTNNRFYILFSAPIVIKFIFTQKPMLLSILILSISILNFFKKIKLKKIDNFDLFFLVSSTLYFSATKYVFMPMALLIIVYFFFILVRTKLIGTYLAMNVIFFFIIIFPISFLKFIHFNDVISPFLEGYFNNASEQILALKQMYLNWSYLPIADEYYLLKSISFLLPSRAWLLLDTFFIAGLSIFFFGFKKNSNIKYLLILLFLLSTLIVVNSNFQSRWYLMFYVLFILSFDTFYSQTYKDFYLKIVRYNFFFINSFFIYYLFTILFFCIFFSIEGAKERLIYLYKETKNINLLSQNYYVLTNSRSNFFLNNSISYSNSKYFNNLLINNYENYNIKYGFFFIGTQINQISDILDSFDKKCFDTKKIITSEVKKRNFLSRQEKEYYIFVEFKKNASTCIIQ